MRFIDWLRKILGPPTTPPPKPLPEVEKDLAYGPDPLQKLDVYRPAGMVEGQTAPAIDMTHGGGWQNDKGDKANAGVIDNKLAHYLALGYIVVSGNYRLWTETNGITPADEAQDVARKLAFVQKLPGVDPKRVTLMGHSAGGNLVAQVGASVELQSAYGYLSPAKIVCLDAVYDIPKAIKAANATGNKQAISLYKPFGADPAVQRMGSPTYSVSAPMPPCFLAYSTQEGPGRKSQADGFAAAIVKNGGPQPVVQGFDLSHGDMDAMVGLPGPLTDAVDGFVRGLG